MKEYNKIVNKIIKEINFTLKSIIPLGILSTFVIFLLLYLIGFSGTKNTIITIVFCSGILLFDIFYISFVLAKYYTYPKNKDNINRMGVVFYINTYGNKKDFISINNKLCENFAQLSEKLETNKMNVVILPMQRVETIKDIYNSDIQEKIIKKTNCTFGLFLKALDSGEGSSQYELQMNAKINAPNKMRPNIEKIFKINFDYIFDKINSTNINKKDDLKDLKSLSAQLFIICQFIYGVAHEYTENYDFSINLFLEMLEKTKTVNNNFYTKIRWFITYELCNSCLGVISQQYFNFVNNGVFNTDIVNKMLNIMRPSVIELNDYETTCDYHTSIAIVNVISGKILEAQSEINKVLKNTNFYKNNSKSIYYSEVFLIACSNNPKKYWNIYKKYKALENDTTQDSYTIFKFILNYYKLHQDNLGLKLALIFLTYFKSDLSFDLLPNDLIENAIIELNNLNKADLADCIIKLKSNASL